MAVIWYVDIPDKDSIETDNECWTNLGIFDTKEAAIAYCLEHIVNDPQQAEVFITQGEE